ncbi:MAG: hypothetical protein WBC96_08735 [Thermodesulfobacteriota bacterium]
MKKIKGVHRNSFVLLLIVLIVGSILSIDRAYAITCLPTCNISDGQFFVFIAKDQPNGISNPTQNFGITSPAHSGTVEIGIFDGDSAESNWDIGSVDLKFTVFADPMGDGSGTIVVAQWTSDDTPNNDWFNKNIVNVESALSEDGTYKYNLFIEITDQDGFGRNSFKVRTDGFLLMFPNQMFSFNLILIEQSDFETIFPDISQTDPSCFTTDPQLPPFAFCDARDPSCCLFNSTYDGTWTFFFEVPSGQDRLEVWDGDFDFGGSVLNGSGSCVVDGINTDTNDLDTGPIVPSFALATDSLPQGVSTPTNPLDDLCSGFAPRSPSVVYDFIDPNGVVHTNVNPSGNQEWELFSITTVPPLNPLIDDLLVNDIPEGIWEVRTRGLDVFNVNLFLFDMPIVGVDDEGNPVFPDESPTDVPTLNQWGILGLSLVILFTSIVFIRRQRKITQ